MLAGYGHLKASNLCGDSDDSGSVAQAGAKDLRQSRFEMRSGRPAASSVEALSNFGAGTEVERGASEEAAAPGRGLSQA